MAQTNDSGLMKFDILTTASFVLSQLGPGTWYWRVKPVFLLMYQGETAYSSVSSFVIEKAETLTTVAVEIVIPPQRMTTADIPSEPIIAIKPEPAVAIVNSLNIRKEQYYTIQPGDTLGKIARQYYGDPMQWSRISEANNIVNPDLIYPGQMFIIP